MQKLQPWGHSDEEVALLITSEVLLDGLILVSLKQGLFHIGPFELSLSL